MARIVLNTFGSFGDLHPFLAIALELKRRGHQPLIAAPIVYHNKVSDEGIDFAAVRPDVGELQDQPERLRKLWDRKHGSEYLLKKILAPYIEGAFDDLREACRGANLLLTHTAGFAGPIVAEVLHLRWLSVALQPVAFFSTYDPPVLAPVEWLHRFKSLGRWPFLLARQFGRFQTRRWLARVVDLRRRLGLPVAPHPLFEGQFSPYGTLALFSRHFAKPQPDWPPNVTVTGFVFYDKFGEGSESGDVLDDFLAAGPPPIVFTLGSSAVMHPGSFFRESAAAAAELGRRAVLVASGRAHRHMPHHLPPSILSTGYVPYSKLLPAAALAVHQGGIGTTAQALAAGKPMLVVPWAHDQPDNAALVERLGLALTLRRSRYARTRVTEKLDRLLNEPAFSAAAHQLGSLVRHENGTAAACDAIEEAL